ncbi:MAG: AAA family ATPase [Candidatus Paceibacterota bacterium]
MIIGITGTDGAGKGTVVEYLVNEKGFVRYHARTLFLEEIARQELEPTRANMRIVGNQLRGKHGNDYIVRMFLERAKESGDKHVIIDSLRARAEAETLKTKGGILLAVDADQKLRYERVQARRSSSDQVSFDEFREHEELESNDPDPHGMQKQEVIAMADHVILNNGTLEDLHALVDDFLTQYGNS